MCPGVCEFLLPEQLLAFCKHLIDLGRWAWWQGFQTWHQARTHQARWTTAAPQQPHGRLCPYGLPVSPGQKGFVLGWVVCNVFQHCQAILQFLADDDYVSYKSNSVLLLHGDCLKSQGARADVSHPHLWHQSQSSCRLCLRATRSW